MQDPFVTNFTILFINISNLSFFAWNKFTNSNLGRATNLLFRYVPTTAIGFFPFPFKIGLALFLFPILKTDGIPMPNWMSTFLKIWYGKLVSSALNWDQYVKDKLNEIAYHIIISIINEYANTGTFGIGLADFMIFKQSAGHGFQIEFKSFTSSRTTINGT